jgi:O-antigen/teichoic acid export membrane protein
LQVHEKLIAGLRAHTFAKLFTQIVSWAGTIYVLRTLDSEALGLFAIAAATLNYALIVYDGGVTDSIVQRPPTNDLEHRAVFTVVAGAGLLLGAGLAMLSGLVGVLVSEMAVAPLVMAMGLVVLLTSLGVLPGALLTREMAFGKLATIASVHALVATLVTTTAVTLGAGAWAMVAGLLVGAGVRALMLNRACPGLLRPTLCVAAAWPHLRMGGVLMIDTLLWRLYTSIDLFLLGRWWGAPAAGVFGFAQHVANIPLEKISTIVNDVSLPAYSELAREREAAAKLMLETIRMHATVGFPIFWGLVATAEQVVPLLFGAKWAVAVWPLMAMAAIAPLRLIGSVETPAMAGLGKPGVLVATKLVIAPCMIVALAVGVSFRGVQGAALAWLLAFPLCFVVAFRLVLGAIGLTLRDAVAVTSGPAIAAAIMAIGVWSMGVETGVHVAFDLAIRILAGALAYALLLRLIDHDAYRIVWSRLSRLAGMTSAASGR